MRLRHSIPMVVSAGVALVLYSVTLGAARERASVSVALVSGRVAIAGTSNIHAYAASSTAVRLTRIEVASAASRPTFWDDVLKPGGVTAFEVAIAATSLVSGKDGLDKNMHKALKAQEHRDITFRLLRLEPGTAGRVKAVGILRIAGAEREVALNITTQRTESQLTVKGDTELLMTDYGIAPPKAMLGMLKTDPKVTITFEAVLTIPVP